MSVDHAALADAVNAHSLEKSTAQIQRGEDLDTLTPVCPHCLKSETSRSNEIAYCRRCEKWFSVPDSGKTNGEYGLKARMMDGVE